MVEVHRGPSPAGWSQVTRHGRAERLALEAFPDVVLTIASVLG